MLLELCYARDIPVTVFHKMAKRAKGWVGHFRMSLGLCMEV